MQRADLEHIIRAASAITDSDGVVVVGSQAILGQYPNAPSDLLVSVEADVYPRSNPEKAIIIDGAIGEQSSFHAHFGYYAHGVAPETAVLPPDFQKRLVEVRNENTNGYSGWCLEANDLAVSKLVAGRDKDMDFVRELLKHKMVSSQIMEARAKTLAVDGQVREMVLNRIYRLEREEREKRGQAELKE